MSVTATHPQYDAALTTWDALANAYEGEAAVKGETTRYLPRPAGMKHNDDYAAYLMRPAWGGATEMVANGLVGMIFRREPELQVPTSLEDQLGNITRTGIPLRTFAEQVTLKTLLMGRHGILVDFPAPTMKPDGTVEPPPPGTRPYWIPYLTQEIINWHMVEREGAEHVDMIVLRESIPTRQGEWPSDDYFIIKAVEQCRVLRLNEAGLYEVSIWREVSPPLASPFGQVKQFEFYDSWIPDRMGRPLTFIPFVPLSPFTLTLDVQKSLLEPLVEINYRYFRHSADYEQSLHLTASPWYYVCSDYFNVERDKEFVVGSMRAMTIPDSRAQVGIAEFKGQGLEPQRKALEDDIREMATKGARILEAAPLIQETLGAVINRTQGAESPLQILIRTVSEGITQALRWHAWWAGATEDPKDENITYALNTDLISAVLDPAMFKNLVEARLNHELSKRTLYWNLQRGEIARPMVTFEEEQAEIETEREEDPLAPVVGVNGRVSGNGVAA